MAPVPPPSTIFVAPDGRIFFRTDIPYIYIDSLGNSYYEEGLPFDQNPPVGSFIIPSYQPGTAIPNNPFYAANANNYNLSYPTGQLIFGDFLFVDYTTGNVYISPNPPNNGTVTQITAGVGLETSPVSGITTAGTIGLKAIPTITPGSYTYPTIAVNGYGKLTLAVNGPTPLTSLIGTAPIYVTGTNPTLNLGISLASTSAPGAVQLDDSLTSSSSTRALTAQQGYNLGLQMSFLGNTLAGQVFAGMIDTATGNIAQLTTGGAALGGLTVGSPLPAGAPVYDNAFFVLDADGTYTPPGGVATPVVKDDRVICINGNWEILFCGTRLANASSGVAGLTVLATPAEVLARTEANKSVTAGSLSIMVASETQDGFVELATNAETQAFTDNTRAVTAASVGSLQATTTTRGLVQLSDSTSDPSVITAPTSNALTAYYNSTIHNADVTAQGDLIVGLGYQTPGILPKGTSRSYLTVDDTKPFQGSMDWNVPDSLVSWPVGAIVWYCAPLAPTSLWLECDGRLLDGDINGPYYDLYDLIGTTFNTGGEPAGFFRLPDLRGMFVRGWSGSGPNPTPSALDPGRLFATTQSDAFKQHNHTVTDPGHIHQFSLTPHAHPSNSGTVTHTHTTTSSHSHGATFKNAEVVGDQGGLYDGAGQWGPPQGPNSVWGGPLVSVGNFTNVSVTQPDGTYPGVVISGGSNDAAATVVVSGGKVVSVTVTNGGTSFRGGQSLALVGPGFSGFGMSVTSIRGDGSTGVSFGSANTGLGVATAYTGMSVNIITTGLTVDNAPPAPPNPNETRPYNVALLPMIKYRIP